MQCPRDLGTNDLRGKQLVRLNRLLHYRIRQDSPPQPTQDLMTFLALEKS